MKWLFLLFPLTLESQIDFNVLQQDTSICGSVLINTSAVVTNPPRSSTSYTVSQIATDVKPYGGTLVNLSDDQVSPSVSIGFTFCFFGNSYTQAYIGSNGWLGFTAGQSPSFTSFTIPSIAPNVPRNCIMGPWYDIHTGIAGTNPATPIQYVYYYTAGTAPYRYFVVSWVNAPLFQCVSLRATQQIVIYETYNRIDNSIVEKRVCATWANGTATQGLHSLTGPQALVVPGRNSTIWTVSIPETWRYEPSGPLSPPPIWYVNGVYHSQSFDFNQVLSAGTMVYCQYTIPCVPLSFIDQFTIQELPCCDWPTNLIINTNQ